MYNQEDMICSFCVNDYHLAVMITPYIYEEINKGKKVITFLNRDLDEYFRKVIATNKKFWEEEKIFERVDMKKTRFDKISEKFENVQNDDVVIVAGDNEFIDRINRLLINFHTNFTLVNCFNVSDIIKNENFKVSDYSKILNTKGLEKIENADFV